VIMGGKTWDSIPPSRRPLKDRFNIVITRHPELRNASSTADSIETAIKAVGATIMDRKAFVIGGAQLYGEALARCETKRILFTRILSDFECDTFFPVELREDGEAEGWVRRSKEELDAWVGETVPGGIREENGTKYVFEMWERKDIASTV